MFTRANLVAIIAPEPILARAKFASAVPRAIKANTIHAGAFLTKTILVDVSTCTVCATDVRVVTVQLRTTLVAIRISPWGLILHFPFVTNAHVRIVQAKVWSFETDGIWK
jgi:hypothetical protein